MAVRSLSDVLRSANDGGLAAVSGDLNLEGRQLENMRIKSYSEIAQNLNNISGAVAVDYREGSLIKATAVDDITWSFTNLPVAGSVVTITIELTNGGSYVQNWPANTEWAGGTPPTLTSVGKDIIVIYTSDAGASFQASLVVKNAS